MSIKFSIRRNQKPHIISSFAGGIICLSLSILGFYVAVYGQNFEGGVPFMADAANQLFGRFVFGFGAVITGLLAGYAFYEIFKSK